MSTGLTRDEREILDAYGWLGGCMLAQPDTWISHAKSSHWGRSVGRDDWSWQTTGRGIEAVHGDGRTCTVTWPRIRELAAQVPPELKMEHTAACGAVIRETLRGNRYQDARWMAAWVCPPPEWLRTARDRRRTVKQRILNALAPAEQLDLFDEAFA